MQLFLQRATSQACNSQTFRSLCRREGDGEYMNLVVSEIGDEVSYIGHSCFVANLASVGKSSGQESKRPQKGKVCWHDSLISRQACTVCPSQTVTVFLTTGDEKGCGLFLLAGPEQIVADVASRSVWGPLLNHYRRSGCDFSLTNRRNSARFCP